VEKVDNTFNTAKKSQRNDDYYNTAYISVCY